MHLQSIFKSLSKISIRLIYSLYFVCQLASMVVTCFCIVADQKINTFWLACAIPVVSLFVLSIYMRYTNKNDSKLEEDTQEKAKRDQTRNWLKALTDFLFTTNLGLLLLALLSAAGQSLSVKAIVDIYYEITRAVDHKGEIFILAFGGLVFLSRLLEMYLCKEMICNQGEPMYQEGAFFDILRQGLHTFNFAVSIGLNTFITIVTLMTLGYYPTMQLSEYYIILLVCLGAGVCLSILETTYYVMSLQKEEDYSTIAVISPSVAAERSQNLEKAQSIENLEESNEITQSGKEEKKSAQDSEKSKDRAGNALTILGALCF